ncbi:PepSY domain-containing protein [Viridibacillus sp. YIM B01967]|uniref:PepSY domain-containing protein n=1 Tax=Viridibacillus soli TaxID=2798301 RepID=A0ABS1H7W8_9BACL|nr:PepSY domain-containing protein [Viridibacillus soli]MBK3495518.1 PepSY domain-containing protein [Viridibacillus soli]
MHIREKLPILFIVSLIIIAGILSIAIWKKLTNETPQTTAEIVKNIETMYGGEIIFFLAEDDQYKVQLQRNNAIYNLKIDPYSGKVLQMKQEKMDVTEKAEYLSETEIRKIVKEQYKGKIEKMTLNTQKEEPVYQIEIVNNKKETNLLIDALSGEVLSEIQAGVEQDSSIKSK